MVGVRLENVSKSFGEVKAVDRISLEVKKGELFFLLGPSGCGKTTVLRLIAGFYTPDRGEIYFDQRLMNAVPPHKRNTGMVFQNYALWPHMTVKKNVEYGLDIRNIPSEEKEARVKKALEIVRMLEYADKKPAQLSGGEQQRVALARALIIEPDLLLLDEPLSNLDAKLRLEMREEIKRIHQQLGITSIYVTHDQKEALSMASRIAVMNCGRIEQIGPPRALYENPVNRFVASFIGETNFIEGKILEADSGGIVVETSAGRILSTAERQVPWKAGEEVVCSIRPESIVISDYKREYAPNQFEATIECFTYMGDNEEYTLRVNNTYPVKSIMHNPSGQSREKGTRVWISVEPEDVILLRKE